MNLCRPARIKYLHIILFKKAAAKSLRRDFALHLYGMKSAFLLLCVAGIFFTACNPSSNHHKTRTVFRYNEINGLTSLDPAGASSLENIWPVNQLFNGLLEMDDSLNLLSSIAKNWEISQDGKTYTFYLRSDVYFHDDSCFNNSKGRAVIAGDFVFSFNRLYDSRVSSAASLLFHLDQNKGKRGIEAQNDTILKVYLNEPFSAFASILTMKYFSVVPHEAVHMYGDNFRRHPVGTGPFVFKTWQEGTRLVLLKNEKYFEYDSAGVRLPYLDAVSVSYMRDRETAFMEMLGGKFDMLSGADAFNTHEVLDRHGELKDIYSSKFFLQKANFLKTDYIGILVDESLPAVKNSPVRHKLIRQAINYSFDRKKLVKYLRNNLGSPALSGFIPPGMKSYDPNKVRGYDYDPAKARRLLSEAGYPNGQGLPPLILHVSDNYREQVEFIQSQLISNNIPVEVSIEKTPVLQQAVKRGEYALFKKSWVADYADEENFMSLFYSKNFSPEGVNYFHYANPLFDSLYVKGLTMAPGEEKTQLYQQMERIVLEDAPYIAMYYDNIIRLVSYEVEGLSTNPMNLLNLKKVKKHKKG